MRRSIINLSMLVYTGIDTLAAMPVFELVEIMKETKAVMDKIGK